jgi:hypothetical protein
MQTPRRIHLAYGVSILAVEGLDGWRALEFNAMGNVAGAFQRFRLDAPPQLAFKRFPSTEELAAAALRWLEKRPAG